MRQVNRAKADIRTSFSAGTNRGSSRTTGQEAPARKPTPPLGPGSALSGCHCGGIWHTGAGAATANSSTQKAKKSALDVVVRPHESRRKCALTRLAARIADTWPRCQIAGGIQVSLLSLSHTTMTSASRTSEELTCRHSGSLTGDSIAVFHKRGTHTEKKGNYESNRNAAHRVRVRRQLIKRRSKQNSRQGGGAGGRLRQKKRTTAKQRKRES